MAKIKCVECDERKPEQVILRARRKAGGDYRRPGRTYTSPICHGCASSLVINNVNQPGYKLVGSGRWEVGSLRDEAQSAGMSLPPPTPRIRDAEFRGDGDVEVIATFSDGTRKHLFFFDSTKVAMPLNDLKYKTEGEAKLLLASRQTAAERNGPC